MEDCPHLLCAWCLGDFRFVFFPDELTTSTYIRSYIGLYTIILKSNTSSNFVLPYSRIIELLLKLYTYHNYSIILPLLQSFGVAAALTAG